MALYICLALLIAIFNGSCVWARAEESVCEVRARTTAGWMCGARRWATHGRVYASFRGVPYAKQPVGELRFKELEPAEPWNNFYDATNEGHVCPQTDVFYGPLMRPRGMSEKCIFANIHVPIEALPEANQGRLARDLKSPVAEAREDVTANTNSTGVPILVFIHGGGFAFGSGDTDVYGPEHLVSNGIIVITFNYRLNVFGFLSLNSTKVPGNNGLRDMITLLRWVRDNARYLGGDPNEVTIGGQSAGAAAAHLLTLSTEAQGLFKKAILMSGTAIPSFYTTSPVYARFIANTFVTSLGINATDPDEIHQQLVDMPLEKLMEVHKALLDQNGLGVFFPVIESPIPEVKRILPEETEALIAKGHGRDIPLLIGYTNAECESFRKRFDEIDVMAKLKANPLLAVPLPVIFSVPTEIAFERLKKVEHMYFNGTPTIEKYVKLCSDMHFEYPALRLAKYRSRTDGAPTFLYQFSYDTYCSPVKEALGLHYSGAGHVEDLTYVFQVHSVQVLPNDWDDYMKGLMSQYLTNFMRYSQPTLYEDGYLTWRPVNHDGLRYQVLHSPTVHHPAQPTSHQYSMMSLFDNVRDTTS